MSRCIIHVGMPKTGTSSIQQSLCGFADREFFYADIDNGFPQHSRGIYDLLNFYPDSFRERDANSQARRSDALSRLEKSIKRANGRTYILSGEGIVAIPPHDLEKLKAYLRNCFDDVAIVAAVRSPAAFMASAFQEPVKQGVLKFYRSPSSQYRSYRKTFIKFDEVFGRENVHLWKFDPKSYPGGCAVQDFCGRLGIDLPDARIRRANESLSREAIGLLFAYRKFGADLGSLSMSDPQNLMLVGQLMGIGSGKFRFSPDVIAPVLEKNRGDIEWMEARLGQSLHEELGAHWPGDVRDESDLLQPDPVAVSKLFGLLGDEAPEGISGETPEEVALLVHALRMKYEPYLETTNRRRNMSSKVKQPSAKPEDMRVNMAVLIDAMRQQNPKLLKGIPKPKAAALLRNAFRQVSDMLGQAQEGKVRVAGLGQFRLRQVEKEVEGKKTARAQIVFRRAGAVVKSE